MLRIFIILFGFALVALALRIPDGYQSLLLVAGFAAIIIPLFGMAGLKATLVIVLFLFVAFVMLPIPEHFGYWSPMHLDAEHVGDRDLTPVLNAALLLLVPLLVFFYAGRWVFGKKKEHKGKA
jgi:hypothetical protein